MRPAPLREPVLAIVFAGSAVIPALILAAIATVFFPTLPRLADPSTPAIGGLLGGTLAIGAIAMAVAVPLGLVSAAYLAELASPLERRLFRPLFAALAGVPGVAFGWGALLVVGPQIRALFPQFQGSNLLAAGLVLGVMLLPVVSSLAQDALALVPLSLREAGWALGATQLAVVTKVVFPAARTGIGAAVLLTLARAIGETMIVWIAAGPDASLTSRMADNKLYGALDSVLAMGAVLLLFTVSINALAHRWVRRTGSWA